MMPFVSAPRAAIGTGSVIAVRQLVTIAGEAINVPDAEQLVHLQLRRFAGCPICSLHLHSVVQRHDDILAAGIREVVVFHSTARELLDYEADLPFAVIADPDRRLYREFGVESSPRALLDPRAWVPTLRSIFRTICELVARRQAVPATHPHGGRLGLPADFLIASDGRVLAFKYGTHAYDQWSIDALLALVPYRAQAL
jgi:hypothetical protein